MEIWAVRDTPTLYLPLGKYLYSSHHLVLNIDKLSNLPIAFSISSSYCTERYKAIDQSHH